MKKQITSLVLGLLVTLLAVSIASAQTDGGYNLTWSTFDGGGGVLDGIGYTLMGTAGQPDASAALTGVGYQLVGGFWSGASSGGVGYTQNTYLPLVIR